MKGLPTLDPARQELAKELAAWRERRAIDRNRPRGWIIDDAILREIVLRLPRSTEALAALPEMQESVVRKMWRGAARLVRAAGISDPPPPLPRRERPDPEQVALVKRLADISNEVAKELEVSAEVLATRRELEKLAAGKRDVSLLRGWRDENRRREVVSGALTCARRTRRAGLARPMRCFCASSRPPRRFGARLLGALRSRLCAPSCERESSPSAWRGAAARASSRRGAGFDARAERGDQALRDVVDVALGVHRADQPGVGVEARDRLARRLFVLPQSRARPCLRHRRPRCTTWCSARPSTHSGGTDGGAKWTLNTFLQSSHTRRPDRRFTNCSVFTSNSTTASSGVPISASSFERPRPARPCAGTRRG